MTTKKLKMILTNEMKYDTRNDFSKKKFSSYQAAGAFLKH